MTFRKWTLFLLIISSNLIYSQEWIFEYESEYDNFIHESWKNKANSNTIHGVTLSTVPQSGKDRRSRLIELNENGDLVSFFKPTECNTLAFYQPYGQDSIISVSRKCNGEWINTFNIFDAAGNKIFTKEFENKYIKDRIISNENGITILKEGNSQNGSFELLEFSQNNQEKKYSYTFKDFKDPNYKNSINHCIKLNSGNYLVALKFYQPNKKSIITDSYFKLLMTSEENIVRQVNLKPELKKIKKLLEIDNGFLIQGTDRENRHTIIILDSNGDPIITFYPVSPHRSIQPGIFVINNQLYTVFNKIYGSTIYINQYDLSTGEMIKQESVDTEYWRIFNLKIAAVREDHFIVTGGSARSSETKEQRGFVMKKMRPDSTRSEDSAIRETIVDAEKLIEKTSEEILSVKVFPNPATFAITFEVTGKTSLDQMLLRIFSVDGTLISSEEFSGNHIETDISSYQRGSYIYSISSKEKENTITGKFIAQ